ncbi:MAG: carbohydrate binding domain-containing protein [Pirellulales bacterium]|nr:carbohydrate binding domain-containing protein [Pirellulales bacterium]
MFVQSSLRGIAAVLILSFVIAGSVFAQFDVVGPNLIENSSFEKAAEKKPDSSDVLPQGWLRTGNVFRLDDKVARSGRASLRYDNDDKNRYLFCRQVCELEPGRKYRFSVWVKTKDIKGPNPGGTICIEWKDKNGKWLGGAYASSVAGTSDWKQVSGIATMPEGGVAPALQLYTRQYSTGTAWFDDVELVRVAGPPLATIVAKPVYRGWITFDAQNNPVPRETMIRAKVDLADRDLSPEQVKLHAVLRKVNAAGELDKTVLQEVHGKPGELTVDGHVLRDAADLKLSTAGLSPGTYDVETRLIGPDDKCFGTTHEKLVRMGDDFKPHSRIDEHKRLLIDGKPFFPLGMYWHSINEEEIKKYADSKFNCLMPYGSPNPEQMDIARKYGLKVIYSVKDWYYGFHGAPKFLKSAADEEPALRNRVKKYRNHPALLAWYLNDELPQQFMPQLEAHQRIVSEEDPDHPTWVVLYQVGEVRHYRRTCDVIGTDPYPIGRANPKAALPVVAGQWTAETSRQMSYARPLWQVPQIFNWANYWKDKKLVQQPRTPSFDEMRSMAWQCIAEGATGLIFYSWYDIKRNPDVPFDTQWDRVKRIAAEIDSLAPILLSIEPAPGVGDMVAGRLDGLLLLSKHRGGKDYVFAVNDGTAEMDVEFKVKTSKPVNVLGEERTIEPTATGFSDKSRKLSVHVYEIIR